MEKSDMINRIKNLNNRLDRSNYHPLIRSFSHVPFKNQWMIVTNITDEDDKITFTDCTDNENNIDIIIRTLLLTIFCGLSILCLMSLMVYTLLKHLINNK